MTPPFPTACAYPAGMRHAVRGYTLAADILSRGGIGPSHAGWCSTWHQLRPATGGRAAAALEAALLRVVHACATVSGDAAWAEDAAADAEGWEARAAMLVA